jgi:hypothetical protein
MPRAARFLSWVPTLLDTTEQTTGASVPADVFASHSAGLFSTFSIYQNLNKEDAKRSSTIHGPEPAFIEATPEVQYYNASTPAPSQRAIPELDRHFLRLYRQFRKKYDFQFPDTPCAHCGQLLLPRHIEWICFEAQEYYNLTEVLHLPVCQRTRGDRHQVAVCKLCRTKPGAPVNAGPWPSCLLTLPQRSRVFLSPLTLQTSLGRTHSHQAVHNQYTTYRTVTGRMNVTHNTRAIALFSGTIGAYLESSGNGIDRGHDLVHLETCRAWLLAHNALYARHDVMSELRIPPLPLADLFDEEDETEGRPLNRPDIVLNPNVYDAATQDEDYRHFRLPVAAYQNNQRETIGLLRSDPATELLLFPILYPHGRGQWSRPAAEDRVRGKGTRLQDAQRKLNSVISHFRDDHYWPGYIYMEVEAIRIFQNNQRIVSCRIRQYQDRRMPASDLLQQSTYGPWSVINEKLTTAMPNFIRTGDSYFIDNERKIRAMLHTYEIPTLFITLTFSERWPAYQAFLATTGPASSLPSDRPWEAVQYYYERLHWLKKALFRKPIHSGFGALREMVERQEFQQRGAIHSHCLLWCELPISALIQKDYIRADVPDQVLEPLLYALVQKFQIHTCIERLCGGPQPPTGQCRKGFPASLSPTTCQQDGDLRYTYKRTIEPDRWVVPYNAELLILWEGHCNVQYCTSTGLAAYISKYVTKAEPKSIVNVRSNNHTTSHLLARRMGSMECMVLLLSFKIFDMTSASMYLPTSVPTMRTSTVKPVYLLEKDPENPYFANAIEKYFARPDAKELNACTYFQYYATYLVSARKHSERSGWRDSNGYYVYQRKKVGLN